MLKLEIEIGERNRYARSTCSVCEGIILGNECTMCCKKFEIGDTVLCEAYTDNHFCSEECILDYYEPDYRIGKVTLESE